MLVHFLLPLRWRFCTPAHCDLWCWRRPTARVDFYPQLPCPDPVDVKITSVAPFCALSAVVPGTGKNTINIYYLSCPFPLSTPCPTHFELTFDPIVLSKQVLL